MRIFSAHEGKGRRRARDGLIFFLFLSSLISCSVVSPKKQSREDRLHRALRDFHWALMGRDVPVALRYVPADERDPWDSSFACMLERLRLLDYRVELVKLREKAKEATVRVRWTTHAGDSLVVKEMLWKEQWSFNWKKQRWALSPAPDAIKGLPEGCRPEFPEGEESDKAAD